MNNLTTFNFNDNEVRTVLINNEPMFCLRDVCKVLDIKNVSDCKVRLNQKGVVTTDALTNGGVQKMNFINESNLYKVIFQSRTEKAEKFTEWVTSEVLPSIRKTGGYELPKSPQEVLKLLVAANEETNKRIDNLEENLPLFNIDCEELQKKVRYKVFEVMGGKASSSYKNNSLRGLVYSDIQNQLRREFDVKSFKAIKRNQLDKALEIVSEYKLPFSGVLYFANTP